MKKPMKTSTAINIVMAFVGVTVFSYFFIGGRLLLKKTATLQQKLKAESVAMYTGETPQTHPSTTGIISQNPQLPPSQNAPQKTNTACYSTHCFALEIADTGEKRTQGLMYRESLGLNEAMLFVFDAEGVYPFWMKNTLIPLDMLRLDKNGKIVDIAHNVPPCGPEGSAKNDCPNYTPTASANYVLEIKGGLAYVLGMKIGDVVEILR